MTLMSTVPRATCATRWTGLSTRTRPRQDESKPRTDHKRRRPHRIIAYALVIATLVLCLAATSRVRARGIHRHTAVFSLVKRTEGPDDHAGGSLLRIPYDKIYNECPPTLRPLFVAFLVVILMFLFCTISITSSDFFCPNLATLAAYLGLSETTAGVTLLAFGNGSPDVFSTFVSMRQGTFGLAVGELIGAASFITSIVVGSIAMIRPFHVPRFAFLRDVAFFTAAVLVLMGVLHDGKLTLWESGGMVSLYVAYVAVVVAGSWWSARRRRREAYADLGWKTNGDEENTTDGQDVEMPQPSPSLALTLTPSTGKQRRQSSASQTAAGNDDEDDVDTRRAAWSLLGAVEFRDAVNALKREGVSPGSSRGNSRPSSPLLETEYPFPHTPHNPRHHHHRRTSSQNLSREASLRRAGRSRSSSLVAGWLARSRSSSGDHVHSEILQPIPSPMLDTVPASPRSVPLGVDGLAPTSPTSHPAQDNESHPLEHLPRGSHLHITVPDGSHDDEPLSASPLPASPRHNIPHIAVVDPSGTVAPHDGLALTRSDTVATVAERVSNTFHRIMHTLFPSLQGFTHKSFTSMILAVLSTPAVFALTITLPVVDDGRGDEGGIALPGADDEPLDIALQDDTAPRESPRDRALGPEVGEGLHHLLENGFTLRPHMPDSSDFVRGGTPCPSEDGCSDVSECVLEFSPRLTAVQCIAGPLICAYLVFQDEDYLLWVLLGAAICGAAAAAVVYRVAEDGSAQPWRLFRCCCGFVCSMVWIATIADEVVAVLQTVGEIFGLSDAIIGLTIFAVGNSLADLVANVTIAQFAPNMAYAACFGGPMLNLLLGIGGSGTYSILTSKTGVPVHVDFSPTLWVSSTGLVLILLGTAIVVPINRYFIDRRWALCLLGAYAALMTANVVVEIKSEGRK